MPRFNVCRTEKTNYHLIVTADTVAQAQQKAATGAIEHLLTEPGIELHQTQLCSKVDDLPTREEPEAAVWARQAAATEWAKHYKQRQVQDDARRALSVLVLTGYVRDYLARLDPKALEQAQLALNGKSYLDYL